MTEKKQWKFAKDFVNGNIIVRVTQLEGFPRYSFMVGRVNTENELMHHFGVFVDYDNGAIRLREPGLAAKIGETVQTAMQWVELQCQLTEDASPRAKSKRTGT